MKTIFSLFLALTIVTHTAAAVEQSHVVHNVTVAHTSDVSMPKEHQDRLQSRVVQSLKSEGLITENSTRSLRIVIEGYLVRNGQTPAVLRQQGGRDTLRASIELLDSTGATQIDKVTSSFAFEGFENLSPAVREEKLHAALVHAIVDALK